MPVGLASNRLQKRSFRMLLFEACALGENIMARTWPGPGRCWVCPGDLGPKLNGKDFCFLRLGVEIARSYLGYQCSYGLVITTLDI